MLLATALAVVALHTLAPRVSADQILTEGADVGQLPATALLDARGGPLSQIKGTLSSAADVDMYYIFITDPANFSARTTGQPGTLLDSQLYLFSGDGFGVAANDNAALLNPRSSIEGVAGLQAGIYLLAISSFNSDPVAPGGLRLFPDAATGVVGPTGPGGGLALTGWTGGGSGAGTYTIALTGTSLVPEPGSWALFGLGAAVLAGCGLRLRKRTAARNA
jgi:hypothetical protein